MGEHTDAMLLALVTKVIDHAASIAGLREAARRLKNATEVLSRLTESDARTPQMPELARMSRDSALAAVAIFERMGTLDAETVEMSKDIDELIGSAEDTNEARLKAEAESKGKTSFLAHMSHEIRTPMGAIIGMSELAEREWGRLSGLAYIKDIKRAAVSLLPIINEILDFSRINSGRLEIANLRYETASLLNDVLTIIRIRIGDKPIRFETDLDESIPAYMIGDEVKVRQVLLNLLSNAVKYTEEGFVRFVVRHEPRDDGTVLLRFEISDSGIGIEQKDIVYLFGDFNRIDGQYTRYIEGAGLGLSIARTICRALGGDITVESEYRVGSKFTATLSQSVAEGGSMGPLEDEATFRSDAGSIRFSAPDFRVLIVDDNATNLKVVEGLLAPYGMKIDTCKSGADALALVERNHYGLVLMDHMMPGMDGVEATKAIRGMGERFKDLPIVALTANAVSGMKAMFLQNGFNDFLPKPIEIRALNELVEKWVPVEMWREPTEQGSLAKMCSIRIAGLDVMRGVAMVGGTEAMYRKVLRLYCRDVEVGVEFLSIEYAEKNTKNFITQIHALKSASASIGAEALSAEAARLEAAGKKGDMAIIRERIGGFRKSLTDLTGRIGKALAKKADDVESGNGADAPVFDRTILFRLKEALESRSIRAMDELLDELIGSQVDGELAQAFSRAADCILVSDFDEAGNIIDGLLET
ncbi:MAG: response regulator [Candidatus Accumulibacter sp.]|nr:response regulator [Accumulibacter sp.]